MAAQQHLAGSRLSAPLDEIVEARLEEVDAAQLRVLRVLAVARRRLTDDELARLTLPGGHLPRNAAALVESTGLVTTSPLGTCISHLLLAEAIEASLLPAERHALHFALAELEADEPAETAWHLVRAGKVTEARQKHLAAAEEAEDLDPGGTTLTHLSRRSN